MNGNHENSHRATFPGGSFPSTRLHQHFYPDQHPAVKGKGKDHPDTPCTHRRGRASLRGGGKRGEGCWGWLDTAVSEVRREGRLTRSDCLARRLRGRARQHPWHPITSTCPLTAPRWPACRGGARASTLGGHAHSGAAGRRRFIQEAAQSWGSGGAHRRALAPTGCGPHSAHQ